MDAVIRPLQASVAAGGSPRRSTTAAAVERRTDAIATSPGASSTGPTDHAA